MTKEIHSTTWIIFILIILLSNLCVAIGLILVMRHYPECAEILGIHPSNTLQKKSGPSTTSFAQDFVKPKGPVPYPHITFLDSTLQIDGVIQKDIVLNVLNEHRNHLQKCYGEALKNDYSLKGEFAFQFAIIQNGDVRAVVENGTNFPNKQVKQCLLREVGRWKFPGEYTQMNFVKIDALLLGV